MELLSTTTTSTHFIEVGCSGSVRWKKTSRSSATTTDGDVFGGFYSVPVTAPGQHCFDPDLFVFSFESHGLCATPQRFPLKAEARDTANVVVYSDGGFKGRFVTFDGGVGWVSLGNQTSDTFCYDLSGDFEGIETTTLTGKRCCEPFTCCRLVAIQLN